MGLHSGTPLSRWHTNSAQTGGSRNLSGARGGCWGSTREHLRVAVTKELNITIVNYNTSGARGVERGEVDGAPFGNTSESLAYKFHIRYHWDLLAMVFAIEEINQTPDLLPNITLGFWILDSCMSQSRSLRGNIDLLSGTRGLVPGYSCRHCLFPAGIVGELLYGSSLSTISDKVQFPFFMCTVPANSLQIIALAWLMKHFDWTWVAVVASDDDVGVQRGHDIKKEIVKNGGCVALIDKIHLSYSTEKIHRVIEMIRGFQVKVVNIDSSEVHTKMFLKTLASQNVTDKGPH
ncbi:hypothetical protein NDU88_008522 [Pleurodeles waltl]|uniref:Receptor ligand binding region domain-containing protein n=1 Tax=Pleurodeles waltl TaxID=8319 RepID=A0AAV7NZ76_PLEWA|nr:hypothetical protein NDU88_008522 [Pleurodeles waltl]